MVLIALVQGVVSSFDEQFRPFEKTRGQKRHDHAKDDPLRKSAVHYGIIHSTQGAISLEALPEAPLLRVHDPDSQKEIGCGVG